jgi:kinesin family member C2/C3
MGYLSFLLDYILDLINTLEIRSSSQKGGLAVPDANIVPVYSPLDVLELMNVGHKNRAVGFTSMNDRSSRSHRSTILNIQFMLEIAFRS